MARRLRLPPRSRPSWRPYLWAGAGPCTNAGWSRSRASLAAGWARTPWSRTARPRARPGLDGLSARRVTSTTS
eukprot:9180152-Pyramimonas_sp.AAC.1